LGAGELNVFQSQVSGASGQLEDRWWGWVGKLSPNPTTKLGVHVMIFLKKHFRRKICKHIGVFDSNYCCFKLEEKLNHIIGFLKENRHFFA
jgi:hypothetical protein